MKNLWMEIANRFGEESHCRSRKVGAVLIKDGRLIAQGWNGAPSLCDEKDCIRCNMKDEGCIIENGTILEKSICAHAESNCIANAAEQGISTKNSIMYCTTSPCSECFKLISRAGIIEVHFYIPYNSEYTSIISKKQNIPLIQDPL